MVEILLIVTAGWLLLNAKKAKETTKELFMEEDYKPDTRIFFLEVLKRERFLFKNKKGL